MKRKPSPATIISLIALFFSLGGAGLAAHRYLITSIRQIKPSVRSELRRAPTVHHFAMTATGSIAAGSTGTVTATCPSGEASGGGFISTTGLDVQSNVPVAQVINHDGVGAVRLSAWSVTASNTAATALSLTAYAVCVVS